MLRIGYGEAKRGEGSVAADRDPSSVAHLSMRATFSHKGRRKEKAAIEPIDAAKYQSLRARLVPPALCPRPLFWYRRCRKNTGFADELLPARPLPKTRSAACRSAFHRTARACRGRGRRRRATRAGGDRAEGGKIL